MLRITATTLLAVSTLSILTRAQTTITATFDSQTTIIEVPYLIQPTGVQDSRGSFGESLPLVCTSVCYAVEVGYGGCFLDYKVPYSNATDFYYFDYSPEICAGFLCGDTEFQVFVQCMNCIVANGGEAPRPTDSPLPSGYAVEKGAAATERIDQERANGWLRNVTDFCSAQGSAVEGLQSVTATPTTTGPYTTTWTGSQTVTIPQWTGYTGLSSYISSIESGILAAFLSVATGTETIPTPLPPSTSPASGRSGWISNSNQGPTSTSAAAPSASTPNAASRACTKAGGAVMAGVRGAVALLLSVWP